MSGSDIDYLASTGTIRYSDLSQAERVDLEAWSLSGQYRREWPKWARLWDRGARLSPRMERRRLATLQRWAVQEAYQRWLDEQVIAGWAGDAT